jgi:hypothetical protein
MIFKIRLVLHDLENSSSFKLPLIKPKNINN